ncbi:hypothetical protein Tco_0686300 [Tanacetum coccineum]
MSDSEHSTVTYTSVSEDDSDIGSPGVDGPPIMPEDPYAYIMAAYEVPPSPDYIPGPEVPPSPDYIPGPEGPPSPDYVPGPEEPEQAPPSPVYLPYVPEPVYPEYIPPEDDVFLAEEQPLHAATSPTAESPGYIPESDPEEDPEEDPADYPAEGIADDERGAHHSSGRLCPPVHEVERLLALTTQPPSPLTLLSSPLPHIPSPPPNSPTYIEIPESCLSLRKRVRFASPTLVVDGRGRLQQRCCLGRLPDHRRGWSIRGLPDLATIVEEELQHASFHRRLAVMIAREAKMAVSLGDLYQWPLIVLRQPSPSSEYARSDVYVITYYGSGTECIDFRVTVSRSQETEGDFRVIGIRPQETENGTRGRQRFNPGCIHQHQSQDTHTTTSVTNAQFMAMINEGVTATTGSTVMQTEIGVIAIFRNEHKNLYSCMPAVQIVRVPCKEMLLHGGTPMLRPLLLKLPMPTFPELATNVHRMFPEEIDHKLQRFGHLGRDCQKDVPQISTTRANQRAGFDVVLKGIQEGFPKLKNNKQRCGKSGWKCQGSGKGVLCRGLCRGKPRKPCPVRNITATKVRRHVKEIRKNRLEDVQFVQGILEVFP